MASTEKVVLAIPKSNGWLAAPLVGRDGKNMGLLQLADKTEGEFTAENEAILVQLTRLAAIAIENAKLYDELKTNDQRKDEFLAMLAHELQEPAGGHWQCRQRDDSGSDRRSMSTGRWISSSGR